MLYCVFGISVICFKFNIELANLGLGASKVKDQLIILFQH